MERLEHHHIWHTRRWYATRLERDLRNHRGFIIPIQHGAHQDLHHELEPPRKPNPLQIDQLLSDIGEFQIGRGALYVVHHAIEQFHIWDNSSNEHLSIGAEEIALNLEAQTAYLTTREPVQGYLRSVA